MTLPPRPGDRLPDSRQFLAFCAECGEKMRTPHQLAAIYDTAICLDCRGEPLGILNREPLPGKATRPSERGGEEEPDV